MPNLHVSHALEHIFPDIEAELCTKHSSTLSRYKTQFLQLYHHDPTHCAIVNGRVDLCPQGAPGFKISFAMENGAVTLYKKIGLNQNLFINCNREEEQIILDFKGNIVKGEEGKLAEKLMEIYRIGIQDMSLTKVSGGTFYLFSNLPQGSEEQEKVLLTSFFLSVLHINGLLQDYEIKQMIGKMVKTELLGTKEQIQDRFYNFFNRKLCVRLNQMVVNVEVPRDIKLLFYLLKSRSEKKMEKVEKVNKKQFEQILRQNFGSDDLFKILSENESFQDHGLEAKYKFFLNQQARIFKSMQICSENPLQFNKLLHEINILNQFFNIPQNCEETSDLAHQFHEVLSKFKLDVTVSQFQEHLIVQKNGIEQMIISTNRSSFIEMINQLRKFIHPEEKKERFIKKSEKKQDFGGQSIFSGVPSRGIGVFDPTECLWFLD